MAVAATQNRDGGAATTDAEARAWAEQGFFFREAALGTRDLAELREAAEEITRAAEAAVAAGGRRYEIDGNVYVDAQVAGVPTTVQLEHARASRTVRVIEPCHALHPRFEALVDDERIVGVARDLVAAPEVALFTDKLNLKRPREGSRFQWHQDSPYWAHFCTHLDRLPNVMVTLDDADAANGCFRLIPGSHCRGLLPGRAGEGVLGPLFTHPDHFDERTAVAAEVPAGSLVFFSPHSVHGSLPNLSDRPRRAIVLTYQPGGLRMFKEDRVRACGRRG